jgi:hypothetical protein
MAIPPHQEMDIITQLAYNMVQLVSFHFIFKEYVTVLVLLRFSMLPFIACLLP